MKLAGETPEMIAAETLRTYADWGRMNPGTLFWYLHGGLIEASEKVQDWDTYLKRPVREVLEESFEKGWQYVWPRPGNDPKVLFTYASNSLRRVRGSPLIRQTLWPKLRAIVTLDWRMSTTALHSDYVLPVSVWYERTDHKWVTPLAPFVHAGKKATSYYEAKSDWEILSRLTETLEKRAHERDTLAFVDRFGVERSLDGIYRRFSQQGEFGHADDAKVAESIVNHSASLGDVSWEELRERGWARFASLSQGAGSIGNATEIRCDDTITPLTKHVIDKDPYPTFSRRMQFYLDQELYLELGEELPVHKDPPLAGGDYPLMLTSGHTRWSIHSNWRDDQLMLRLQRGVPVMYMSTRDAADRKISDGHRVRVFNDLDSFEIMAKVSPALRPGQLLVYHAWDNFQFRGGKGFQSLVPSPLNPVELAGGHFHIRPTSITLQPGHTDRDTRVEVRRV
jgi:anaerobic selenocysteine-containing dehydrogenase